jgi:hypothetical protein
VTKLKSAPIAQKDVRCGHDFFNAWELIKAFEGLYLLEPYIDKDSNKTYFFEKLKQIKEW